MDNNLEKYKWVTGTVLDRSGKELKYHDVVRTQDGEMLLVELGVNHHHKTKGLTAINEYAGFKDWLSVYPDGELEVFGNADFVHENNQVKYVKTIN